MRSTTGRRWGSSRVYSRKPVILPMQDRSLAVAAQLRVAGSLEVAKRQRLFVSGQAQHALKLVREYLDKLAHHVGPVFENPLGARTSRRFEMPQNQILDCLDIH